MKNPEQYEFNSAVRNYLLKFPFTGVNTTEYYCILPFTIVYWSIFSYVGRYMCKNKFGLHAFVCVCSERIGMRQSQVDKLYAGLKDLSEERRGKLEERFRLFQLNREVDDLEQWIAEREVVAGSHELGQDYEHVTVSRKH